MLIHDTLMKTVESPAGHEAFEFAEVMARNNPSPDGANMLANYKPLSYKR